MVQQVTPEERVAPVRIPRNATRTRLRGGREATKPAPPPFSGLCYQLGGGIAGLTTRRGMHTLRYRPGGALRFGVGEALAARPSLARSAEPACPPEAEPACRGARAELGEDSSPCTEEASVGGDGLRPPSTPQVAPIEGGGAELLRILQGGAHAEAGAHVEAQHETCFLGHALLPSVAHVVGGSCDQCCRQVAPGECFGQCAPCNYWLCSTCDPGVPPASPDPWGCGARPQCGPPPLTLGEAYAPPMALDGLYFYHQETFEGFDPSGFEGVWQQPDSTTGVWQRPDPTTGALLGWAPCPDGGAWEQGLECGAAQATWDAVGPEEAYAAGVCLPGSGGCEDSARCDPAADRSEPEGEPSSEEPEWADGGSLPAEWADGGEWDKKDAEEAPVLVEEQGPPNEQQHERGGRGLKVSHDRGRDAESEPQKPKDKKEKPEKYLTVMLRNIPNKYTREMLVGQLSREYQGEFDFVYLPIDFRHRCNVGYAFVNFRTVEACRRFISQFHGVDVKRCLPGFNSKKVVEVTPARMQGQTENIKRLRNSPVMSQLQDHPDWLPLLFGEGGEPQPFPRPDQALPPMRPRGKPTRK